VTILMIPLYLRRCRLLWKKKFVASCLLGASGFGQNAIVGPARFQHRDTATNQTIETARAKGLVYAPSFNWRQTLLSDLVAGVNTVTLASCPLGVDVTTNNPYYVTINNGMETDIVTGGSCVAGASGTITFTTANAYTTPTIGAANGGIQEALNYAAGTARSGNARWHVMVPPGSYSVYAPIIVHASKGLLEGDGADLNCYTRSYCMFVGSFTNANTYNSNVIRGLRLRPEINDAGCSVTQTQRESGSNTVTYTGSCSYKVGDLIRVDYTDNPAYWGDHFVSAVTSSSVSWLQGSSTIAAQTTPGTIALANDAVIDNGFPTQWQNLRYAQTPSSSCVNPVSANTCSFNAFFDFWDDESAVIDGFNNDGYGLMCATTYCGSFIYSGGIVGGKYGTGGAIASVITLRGSNITAGCGNGVTVYNSNGLHVEDTVIEAVGLWNVMVSNIGGNFQGALLDNVYNESTGCAHTPWGRMGAAGAIYGPSSGASSFTSHGLGLQGRIPVVGSGSTTFNYWIVGHDTTAKEQTAPMLVEQALNNRTGAITVSWPRLAPNPNNTQSSTDTIMYDVIRTSGVLHQAWPPSAGPMPGNCPGGAITACGSVATGVAQCSGLVCTFTDSGSAATSAYAVSLVGTFIPTMTYWPGDLVLSGTVPSPVFIDKLPPTVTAPQGIAGGPVVYTLRCGADEGTWVGCAADIGFSSGLPISPAAVYANVISNPLSGVTTPKGRLNFYNLNGNAFGGTGIITLWDSNPGKTLATVGNRPAMDAADTYLASDNTGQGFTNSQVQLAVGAPVSISEYVNSLPDNAHWLERLTSKAKTFNVPIMLNEGVASFKRIATAGDGVAPIYAAVSRAGRTGGIPLTILCEMSSCGVGQYEIDAYIASTAECHTAGSSAVRIELTYSDDGGIKANIPIPLSINGNATLATSMALGTRSVSAAGHTTLWSTGETPIKYAMSYTACQDGKASYSVRVVVKQLQ
jgi:hypothetical protein